MSEPTPAEQAIREFPFWNYGMDGVDIALREDPEAQEWVPALAAKIEAAIRAQLAEDIEADPAMTNAEMTALANLGTDVDPEHIACGVIHRQYAARIARGEQ